MSAKSYGTPQQWADYAKFLAASRMDREAARIARHSAIREMRDDGEDEPTPSPAPTDGTAAFLRAADESISTYDGPPLPRTF